MIHHLSFPHGGSAKKLGRGCTLAKTGVRSAFCIILVHPKDYHLLAIQWKGNYYVDCALPIWLASSCRSFEKLSTAVEWVARTKLNIPHIIHILDDFLVAADSLGMYSVSLQNFLNFCDDIGVPMAP